jgi:hypothetical protein
MSANETMKGMLDHGLLAVGREVAAAIKSAGFTDRQIKKARAELQIPATGRLKSMRLFSTLPGEHEEDDFDSRLSVMASFANWLGGAPTRAGWQPPYSLFRTPKTPC